MNTLYISDNQKNEQNAYAALIETTSASHSIQRRYFVETYGCQMNVRDSLTISGYLEQMGFLPALSKDAANVIIFNTCCVRDHAEKKLMANIGALKERKDLDPSMIICVCGCMMQQAGSAKKLMNRFKFIDAAFGTNSLWKMPEIFYNIINGNRVIETAEYDYAICEDLPYKQTGAFSSFVNIMFGCDNFCTYCIVPYVRGRERSRSKEDIIREVRNCIEQGASEITLLGQNVNSYGKNTDIDFSDLLRSINSIDGLKRLRFMTSHPKDIPEKLMHTIAECDKVCSHLHLPVQSGSDSILKAMNRHYSYSQYVDTVSLLRSIVPNIELTTDIIVGFPGETEDDFLDTLRLVEEVGYSAAFTFKYSPRIGTKAAAMECQIPESVKKERLKRLNDLQAKMTKISNAKYIGKMDEVLVESAEVKETDILLHGRLSNFKSVYFKGSSDLVGSYQKVRIVSCNSNSLIGEL